ncbi:unnamed protein product [Sphagnum jensenii]|uniref:Uncharacterized protein n=1 Tax=Sphagnum jensenii TaxID=128206 RepID=A0ABP0VH29_9BRYO
MEGALDGSVVGITEGSTEGSADGAGSTEVSADGANSRCWSRSNGRKHVAQMVELNTSKSSHRIPAHTGVETSWATELHIVANSDVIE